MQQPWLSVIIPTYNGERYLAQTLDSILLQRELGDVECIIVDDGSTDKTLAIVDTFSKKIPITLLKKQGNKGWVASTNQALSHTKGEYICFLHQDDLWLKDRLNVFRAVTKKYPDIDFFIAASRFIDSKGRDVGAWRPPLPALPQKISRTEVVEKLLIQNFIAIPSPVFKRIAAIQVGMMDEALWYTADWDFWLKLASSVNTGYISDVSTAFRVHVQSQTLTGSISIEEFQLQLEKVFIKHSKNLQCSTLNIRVSQFSIMVNVALAAGVNGSYRRLFKLLVPFLALGWSGWELYSVNSRIVERVLSRVRAGLSGCKNIDEEV